MRPFPLFLAPAPLCFPPPPQPTNPYSYVPLPCVFIPVQSAQPGGLLLLRPADATRGGCSLPGPPYDPGPSAYGYGPTSSAPAGYACDVLWNKRRAYGYAVPVHEEEEQGQGERSGFLGIVPRRERAAFLQELTNERDLLHRPPKIKKKVHIYDIGTVYIVSFPRLYCVYIYGTIRTKHARSKKITLQFRGNLRSRSRSCKVQCFCKKKIKEND